MAVRVLMPALSPTMTEGNIAKWHKKEGDKIKSGDVLAEIETDKATMEVEAVDEGVLGRIVVPDGTQGVKVNTVIAVILEDGENASVLAKMDLGGAALAPAAPAAPMAPANVAAPQAPAPQMSAPAPAAPQGRVFASPLARRMAEQSGVDLNALRGTGPHGRVVKADIEMALSSGAPARAAAAAPMAAPSYMAAPLPPGQPGAAYEDVPASNMRRVVAQRLQESKQQVPHFYLTIDCEIDALLKLRADLNARSDAYKLSVNDFVVRASALALRKLPKVNASWLGTAIRYYKTVDISVAVAVEDGLITPIIRNADQKGLVALSEEMKGLAARAREKPMKLQPHEYQGGTFSISNLGMYGIKQFEAIINPPQACILAVGAGEQRATVKDGALAIATVMSCTLSVDHRVVDGAAGAEFLKVFKGLIDDPLTMLL
ncbi:MAG: pyruvate dehydrogenase complex dihydrolipoamide acetyltransferase [Alphaproteobacteria bacterium]|nr:pyruvate dehydrogenase complex dihydrolipoamide acetyltransferase [Alphaproteobacteria bacterium]